MTSFILLTPVQPSMFTPNCHNTETDWEALKEAAEEFAIKVIMSQDPMGNIIGFFQSNTKEAMEQFINTVDLDGPMIEAKNVYDQEVEEVVTKRYIK